MTDQIQLCEEDHITNKGDEKRQPEVSEPGEVFVESLHRVVHEPLDGLEDLCMKEPFEQLLRFSLSQEKNENRGCGKQEDQADDEKVRIAPQQEYSTNGADDKKSDEVNGVQGHDIRDAFR